MVLNLKIKGNFDGSKIDWWSLHICVNVYFKVALKNFFVVKEPNICISVKNNRQIIDIYQLNSVLYLK